MLKDDPSQRRLGSHSPTNRLASVQDVPGGTINSCRIVDSGASKAHDGRLEAPISCLNPENSLPLVERKEMMMMIDENFEKINHEQ